MHDLCEQANQQADRVAARHALAGWDSSDGEEAGQQRTQPPLLAKRKALEELQSEDMAWYEGAQRNRDEWDTAYDAGKQKKVKMKGEYVPFDRQNQLF